MIILLSLIILFILGMIMSVFATSFSPMELVGGIFAISGIILFSFFLLLIPIIRMDMKSQILKYRALEQNIIEARNEGESIENAALILKIVEANQWRESAIYYNNTIWDIWIPDEINSLSPIR